MAKNTKDYVFKELEEVAFEVKKEKPAPTPVVTFDRWFALSGKPLSHKPGMSAFTNTAALRSVEQWNTIFKNY